MKVLVLNSGSSSQKIAVYEIGETPPEDPPLPAWEGKVEWEDGQADVRVRNNRGVQVRDRSGRLARPEATAWLLEHVWNGPAAVVGKPSEIDVAGHRVVNGGPHYHDPVFVNPAIRSAIEEMAFIAPLHNRAELEGMDAVEHKCGPVPQVAVFDTGFHQQLPDAAAIYPGPYEWLSRGIRRYGFHGINHQYCARRAARLLAAKIDSLKLVTCHLGHGCSLAAVGNGRSVDTTMGFTPLEGLMMGTRSGSVDPGILTYLMRHDGLTGSQLDDLLNHKSGLLGISGTSSDMREIVAARNRGDERAALAFDIFVHRLRASIGAMAAALGGIDVLVFTGGIGENSPEVRAATCANFGYLGLQMDAIRNSEPPSDREISATNSHVRIFIVQAQEDWAIACDCWKLMSAAERRRSDSAS